MKRILTVILAAAAAAAVFQACVRLEDTPAAPEPATETPVEDPGSQGGTPKVTSGTLSISLTGSATLSKLVITARGGESITSGGSSTINLDLGGAITLSRYARRLDISVPANTYSAGFSVYIYDSDEGCMRLLIHGSGTEIAAGDRLEFDAVAFKPGTLVYLPASLPDEEQDETVTPLCVATYNPLRSKGHTTDALKSSLAFKTMAQIIEGIGADLIGFQEIDDGYATGTYCLRTLCSSMSNCEWHITNPDHINSEYGFVWTTYAFSNGFAFNTSALELMEFERVWLSAGTVEYFQKPSDAYGRCGNPERTCVWAKFRHKASGTIFHAFITHLPTSSQGGHTAIAKSLQLYVADKAGTSRRVLMGDFNASDVKDDANYEGYNLLRQTWTDCFEALSAAGKLSSEEKTYCGTQSGTSEKYYYDVQTFTKNHPERRIDHIMYGGSLSVKDYHTVRTTFNYAGDPCCPSDHLPVVAALQFE